MSWTMTVERTRGLFGNLEYHVFIGAVRIATVSFLHSEAVLCINGEAMVFKSMSAALTEMHKMLNSPPPEGDKKEGER